jgi:hypothetical protein
MTYARDAGGLQNKARMLARNAIARSHAWSDAMPPRGRPPKSPTTLDPTMRTRARRPQADTIATLHREGARTARALDELADDADALDLDNVVAFPTQPSTTSSTQPSSSCVALDFYRRR